MLNCKLGLILKGLIGVCWLLNCFGLGVMNYFEFCVFICLKVDVEWFDI